MVKGVLTMVCEKQREWSVLFCIFFHDAVCFSRHVIEVFLVIFVSTDI